MTKMDNRQVLGMVGNAPTSERGDHDFYRTGAIAVEKLLSVEEFRGTTWEPACGAGDISEVLRRHGHRVLSTDLINRGYPFQDGFGGPGLHDFLGDVPFSFHFDHIITNPPYSLAEDFVKRAHRYLIDRGKVVMLCRLLWLEGDHRRRALFGVSPPTRVWVLSSRPAMARGFENFRVGMIAFAWYVWDRADYSGETKLGWL